MTVRFQCGDGAALVGYAYDDGHPQELAAIAAHVGTCVACADEVKAIQTTREELRTWAPPEALLGFHIATVPSAADVVPQGRQWWRQPLPAWAQVAAAVALFATGVGLGAMRAGSAGTSSTTPAAGSAAGAVSARDLAALEARLRVELDGLRETAPVSGSGRAVAVASTTGDGEARRSEGSGRASAGDEALLQQVRALIRESERRQQQELTLRAAEVIRDVDAQRRGDLARIERTFGQMEGTTGAQVEQQRQLLNYLMRVSQRQP